VGKSKLKINHLSFHYKKLLEKQNEKKKHIKAETNEKNQAFRKYYQINHNSISLKKINKNDKPLR
jgi:hypothetical protein